MKELFSILAQTGGLVAAFLFVALRFLLREKKTMASKLADWVMLALLVGLTAWVYAAAWHAWVA